MTSINERVVVFGGAGFLGRHLIKELLYRGYHVICYDVNHLDLGMPHNNLKVIVGDLFDKQKVSSVIKEGDFVYNLAAMADIDDCLKNPFAAVQQNILGNTLIMDCCVEKKIKKFIFSSSVYANGDHGGIYGATKRSSELLVKEYMKYYGLNHVILQYGTLYGSGSSEGNSIYNYLSSALKSGSILYNGTGEEYREYIHIRDAAKLSVDILKPSIKNKCLILTGNDRIKVKDLFCMIDEILGGIKIRYGKKTTEGRAGTHYKLSPFAYSNDLPEKIVRNPYIDLGSGLIEVIKYIQEVGNKNIGKSNSVGIRKHCFEDESINLAIDFDGVIHDSNKGFYDGTIYGKLIPGAKEAVKKLSKKYKIIIFTAKAKKDRPLINGKTGTELVWEWLDKKGLKPFVSDVTSEKPRAVKYIDDKAILFKDWDSVLSEILV